MYCAYYYGSVTWSRKEGAGVPSTCFKVLGGNTAPSHKIFI